jgi:hypothetical protein
MIYACQVDVGMSIGKWLSLSEKRGSVSPRRVAQYYRNLQQQKAQNQ